MSNKRIDMRQIRQIYRLYAQGVSKVQISKRLQLSRNTVKKYIDLFQRKRLTYADIEAMDDSDLGSFLSSRDKELPEKRKQLRALFPYFEKD